MYTHFWEEEVVEADDVLVVGQHVAEPGDHPWQREYRANLALLHEVVHLGIALLNLIIIFSIKIWLISFYFKMITKGYM